MPREWLSIPAGRNMPSKPSTAQPTVPSKPSQAEIDSTAILMKQTMDLVRIQMKRVKNDASLYNDALAKGRDAEVSESRRFLFADVHYLLISLHNVEQLFSRLKRLAPHETELTDVRNRYRKWLRRCGEFRTSIDLNETKLSARVIDGGRLEGNQFCLNGQRMDISSGLENEIESFFKDLSSAWDKVSDRQKTLRELISKRAELAS
jgi:hypothetical protein